MKTQPSFAAAGRPAKHVDGGIGGPERPDRTTLLEFFETLGNVAIDNALRCECYRPTLYGGLKDVAYSSTRLIMDGRQQRYLVFALYFYDWQDRVSIHS